MGPYYQLVNIDRRQSTGFLGKWGEFRDACRVCQWISRNKTYTLEEVLETTDLFRCKRIDNPANLGSFDKIPVEVIDAIFKALSAVDSAIFLAITNSRLFAIGYRTMSQRVLDTDSAWMYDRIICIGDEASDLPSGCLTEDEKLRFLEEIPAKDKDGNLYLYCIAEDNFTKRPRAPATPNFYRDNPSSPVALIDRIRWEYARTKLCKPIKSPVLINTTKKKYVRPVQGIELEVVIVQLLVWGHPDGHTVDVRGPWAGDRLAIVEMDDLAARMARQDGWKDFTKDGLVYQDTFLEMFDY